MTTQEKLDVITQLAVAFAKLGPNGERWGKGEGRTPPTEPGVNCMLTAINRTTGLAYNALTAAAKEVSGQHGLTLYQINGLESTTWATIESIFSRAVEIVSNA